MCGRVIQSSRPLRHAIVEGLDVCDSRMGNVRPRYNAAPIQELLVILANHQTGVVSGFFGGALLRCSIDIRVLPISLEDDL